MVDPSYQELGPEQIPTAYPEGPDGPVKIKVISGKSHGVESPVRPLGGCWYFHVIFDKKSTIFQDIRTREPSIVLTHVLMYFPRLAASWTAFAYGTPSSTTLKIISSDME